MTPQPPSRDLRSEAARLVPPREWLISAAILLLAASLELAAWLLARSLGAQPPTAAAVLLLSGLLCVTLLAPVLAAAAPTFFLSVFRAGLLADGTFLAMLVLYFVGLAGPPQVRLDLLTLLELYCTYLAMALAVGAVVGGGASPFARYTLAVAMALLLAAAMATPFWGNGLIAAADGPARQHLVAALVYVNPLYSISAAAIDSLGYVVHQARVLYQLTLIGDFAGVPSYPWYAASLLFGLLALAAFALRALLATRAKATRSYINL